MPPDCDHPNEERLADNGPTTAGEIRWCPDCGALSVTPGIRGGDRRWRGPGPPAVRHLATHGNMRTACHRMGWSDEWTEDADRVTCPGCLAALAAGAPGEKGEKPCRD